MATRNRRSDASQAWGRPTCALECGACRWGRRPSPGPRPRSSLEGAAL